MFKSPLIFLLLLAFPAICSAQGTGGSTVRPGTQENNVSTLPFENGEGESASESEFEEEEDEIETDRDSFTPTTNVVGSGRIVFESAYSLIDNRDALETHSFPEFLARYGINDKVELRLGWNYEIGGAESPVSGNSAEHSSVSSEIEEAGRLLYGAKFLLSEQYYSRPNSSFIVQGFTPTSGETNDSNLSATYIFGWKLINNWTWDSALRYGTGSLEEDHFNVWSPSTVVKIPIGERWKAHAEYFGVFTEDRENETVQQFFSPGIHYLINKNVEVGVRVGWGLNHEAPNFFLNVGGGWRF